MSKNNKGWIAVDLDGTLAHYDGWKGIEHIGAPIAPMVARVKRWLAEGLAVKIFTARVDGGEVAIGMGDQNGVAHKDVPAVRMHIEAWCLEHIGQILPVTNVKDYGMAELWDDRAVQVEANTGHPVGFSTRGLEGPAQRHSFFAAAMEFARAHVESDAADEWLEGEGESPEGEARFKAACDRYNATKAALVAAYKVVLEAEKVPT